MNWTTYRGKGPARQLVSKPFDQMSLFECSKRSVLWLVRVLCHRDALRFIFPLGANYPQQTGFSWLQAGNEAILAPRVYTITTFLYYGQFKTDAECIGMTNDDMNLISDISFRSGQIPSKSRNRHQSSGRENCKNYGEGGGHYLHKVIEIKWPK